MKNFQKIVVIIPLIIIGIIIGFIINEQSNDEIPLENIIEQRNFDGMEFNKIKTDEEIFNEIEERYDQINKKNESDDYQVMERQWQKSGPFSIDRKEYALGEKIFLIIEGLKANEFGQISVLRTLNQTHYSVWQTYDFDGAYGESFNVYFEPKLFKQSEICSKDDLLGNWIMVFQNTNYENLKFKIVDKIVAGDEDKFNTPVC